MPYMQATMLEILRLATPVPYSARTSVGPNKLEGYDIPKNSILTINLHSIHRDEQDWDQPEEFRPERFLQDGRVVIGDKMMPFGHGKRSCPGESTARLTLFIFDARLLQKFTFSVAKCHSAPSLGNLRGISRVPPKFWVSMALRWDE